MCTCVFVYIYIYTYIYIYVHMRIHVYVYVYVRVCVCVCVLYVSLRMWGVGGGYVWWALGVGRNTLWQAIGSAHTPHFPGAQARCWWKLWLGPRSRKTKERTSHVLGSPVFPLCFHGVFHRVSIDWVSIGFPLAFHWLSIGCALGLPWLSVGFSLRFHWVSIAFPLSPPVLRPPFGEDPLADLDPILLFRPFTGRYSSRARGSASGPLLLS